MRFKKAITQIVSISLLIIFTIVVIINFQNWNTNYNSVLYSEIEKNSKNNFIEIEDLIYNKLYLNNHNMDNIFIKNIKIDSYDCNINQNISPGITPISLELCLKNVSNNKKIMEIIVISKDEIVIRNFYLDKIKIRIKQPKISFQVDNDIINLNDSIFLTWSSNYVDNCTASGDWNGVKNNNGSELI